MIIFHLLQQSITVTMLTSLDADGEVRVKA
jgi:hypothetical protein